MSNEYDMLIGQMCGCICKHVEKILVIIKNVQMDLDLVLQ